MHPDDTPSRIQRACEWCGVLFSVRRAVANAARFCSVACKGDAQRRDPSPNEADLNRLWSRIDRSGGPDACWPWLGARSPQGYGVIRWRGRQIHATRAVWDATHGQPPSLLVCHTCDNPPCCNPAHLFLGTHADNAQDAVRKGHMPNGSRHRRASLTAEDVATIRATYVRRSPELGGEALARRFGVSSATISLVVARKTYPDD